MIRVQADSFDAQAEVEAFRLKQADYGALASFAGYVRGEAGSVSALELQHYPGFTEAQIEQMEARARAEFEIQDVLIIHRYGKMQPGEVIVLVAVTASHRKPALEAVDFLMDYLKTEAPFWKKQSGASGDEWIEPKQQDYAARAGWEDKT